MHTAKGVTLADESVLRLLQDLSIDFENGSENLRASGVLTCREIPA